QEENQYTAIKCFQEALRVFDPASQPGEHARLCRWLGDAYRRMPRDSAAEAAFHLGAAIRWYEAALAGQPAPAERVHALHGLALAHAQSPQRDLRRAAECCRLALPLLGPARMQGREALLRFLLGQLCL